jgi:hypothetical protein
MDTLQAVREGWTGSDRWIVGVGAEYGAYVEFGTRRMRAQPYLFPAARQVVRTQLPALEARARTSPTPLDTLVALLATAIEAEAKRRAPVDTGNLRASIEAAPIGEFTGGGDYPTVRV